jgi:ABC-type taurine transport system ATPase subunit
LLQAVEKSLKSLNLFHGGVADKQAGKYSGGMKRRLSVAISLIGDPRVCFLFNSNFSMKSLCFRIFVLCFLILLLIILLRLFIWMSQVPD